LLAIAGLKKSFDLKSVLRGIDLVVESGERVENDALAYPGMFDRAEQRQRSY